MKAPGLPGNYRSKEKKRGVGRLKPAQHPDSFSSNPAIPNETTPEHAWVKEFPAGVTVCDADGTIIEMNDRAARIFEEDGGRALIGKNVFDCHSEPARSKCMRLLETRQRNVYTIEKKGVKKLIYQSPWYQNGAYAGFIELSLEIPFELPHFVRG
ncbi:MAG: PAS domain-containing protein [Anaerolineales bacterium]